MEGSDFEVLPTEFRSHIRWRAIERGDDHPLPLVLFFEDDPPDGLIDSGLYINYEDFQNVQRDLQVTSESLANWFHTLVLFFAQEDPRLYEQAYRQLRYNPGNHASWNREAWTYKYYVLADAMQEYAAHTVDASRKIKGIGRIGRRVMRAVLSEEGLDD